jgi:hypothetical protein
MKKNFGIILFFLLISVLAQAQPNRKWSTYYGNYASYGNPNPQNAVTGTNISAIAYDARTGYVYVAGNSTDSSGIATAGSFKSVFIPKPASSWYGNWRTQNAFIAKFDTLGNRLWATYFGGNLEANADNIVVDTSGNIYIAGTTNSDSGIGTTGTYRPNYIGINTHPAPFLAKFNSNGQRIWGTYYGQSGFVNVTSVGLTYDKTSDNVYIAGITSDTSGIATSGSFQDHLTMVYDSFLHQMQPTIDGFIARFNTNGQRLWATYYGGVNTDYFTGIWADGTGNIYTLGQTTGPKTDNALTTPGADEYTLIDSTLTSNAFMVKFNSTGQRQWGTYIGNGLAPMAITGNNEDNEERDVYVAAYTQFGNVTNNTTSNAYQASFGGSTDMVLAKYNAMGVKQWSTYFGGPGVEPSNTSNNNRYNNNLSIAPNGNLFVVGNTNSTQGIQKGCSLYPATHHASFISQWQPNGYLLWSSYYDANLFSVCAGKGNNFFVGGGTSYDSLTTAGALQTMKVTGKTSGLIARFTTDINCLQRSFHIAVQNGNKLSVDSGYASYQWYGNGSAISGANGPSYTATVNTGNFFVTIADSCGCTYTSDTLNLQNTGITQANNAGMDITVYPNPSAGQYTLSGTLNTSGNVLGYIVTDVSGKTLVTSNIHVTSNTFTFHLDLSSLADGLYFLKIQSNSGKNVIKLMKGK